MYFPEAPKSIESLARRRRYSRRVSREIAPLARALPIDYVSAAGLTRSDLIERAEALSACASGVQVGVKDLDFAAARIARATYCHQHTICSCCSGRLMRRRIAIYGDPIRRAAAQYPYRYMITWTVRSLPLHRQYDYLNRSLARFVRDSRRRLVSRTLPAEFAAMGLRRGWAEYRKVAEYHRGEWDKVRAGIVKTEIKEGKQGAHVHAHGIVFCSERIDWSRRGALPSFYIDRDQQIRSVLAPKLMREWIEATDHHSTNIEITPLNGWSVDKVAQSAREVLKYASKDLARRPEFALAVLSMLQGRHRLFRTYRRLRRRGADRPPAVPGSDSDSLILMAAGADEYVTPIHQDETAYNTVWSEESDAYGALQLHDPRAPEPIHEALIEAAKIQGAYRRSRNEAVRRGAPAAELDELKRGFRLLIADVYKRHGRAEFHRFQARHAQPMDYDRDHRRPVSIGIERRYRTFIETADLVHSLSIDTT